MSLYRYARDSKTSAQRDAAKWQQKVDEKIRLIELLETTYPHMTATDMRRSNLARAALRKLMSENPNEA